MRSMELVISLFVTKKSGAKVKMSGLNVISKG